MTYIKRKSFHFEVHVMDYALVSKITKSCETTELCNNILKQTCVDDLGNARIA